MRLAVSAFQSEMRLTVRRIFLLATALFHVVNHIQKQLLLLNSQQCPFVQQRPLFPGQRHKIILRKELAQRHAKGFADGFQC